MGCWETSTAGRRRTVSSSARVVHISPALFGSDGGLFGGAERYVFELARHMAQEVRTTLVTFGPEGREMTVGPLKIHVLGKPWYIRGQRFNPIHSGLLRLLVA